MNVEGFLMLRYSIAIQTVSLTPLGMWSANVGFWFGMIKVTKFHLVTRHLIQD